MAAHPQSKPDAWTLLKLRDMPTRKRRLLAYLARRAGDDWFTRRDLARALRVRTLNRHAITELEQLVTERWIDRERRTITDRVRSETIYPSYTNKPPRRSPARRFRWYYVYQVNPSCAPSLRAALRPKRRPTRPKVQPRAVFYSSPWTWLLYWLGFRG